MRMEVEDAKYIALKKKVNTILTDRSKVNDLVDIIAQLDGPKSVVVVRCIQGLGQIFSSFVRSGECSPISDVKGKRGTKKDKEANDPDEIFHTWINRNYNITIEKLLEMFHSSSTEVQEASFSTLMEFLQTEGQKLNENHDGYNFPNKLFWKIIHSLVNALSKNDHLIKLFKSYLHFTDISYYALRSLRKIISKFLQVEGESKLSCTSINIYSLLRHITIPQSEEDIECQFITPVSRQSTEKDTTEHGNSFKNLTSHKKVFSATWMLFLSLSLDVDIHRQVLVILHEKVLPHLVDPKLLMDFLTDSYNIGGVASILSLNSLFILIHQHNLDYPDFYKKLYSLFDAEIFHMKYRDRFFYLADLFLTSTHLPAYLVAAFIKRLSRLALRAPPYGVALLLVFVGNLIKRHPSCKVLIQSSKAKNEDQSRASCMQADSFIEDEPNPVHCRALASSLWELETLRHHYYPGIKSLVELFDKPINKNETDLSEYFDSTFQSYFDDECMELTKNNAFVEFYLPKKLFSDTMDELWDIK